MDFNLAFSADQLLTLLLGCGYSTICGLNLGKKILDNNTVLKNLNELVKFGFLKAGEECFILDDRASAIIHTIGKAENYNVILTKQAELPDICFYCGDEILVCTHSSFDNYRYSFCFVNTEDLFEKLCEEGYLPSFYDNELYNEDEALKFENSIEYATEEPLSQDSAIVFSLEISVKNDTCKKYMKVIEYYFFSYVLFYVNGEQKRCAYSKDNVKKILKDLMEK